MIGRRQYRAWRTRRKMRRHKTKLRSAAMRLNSTTVGPSVEWVKHQLERYTFYHRIKVCEGIFTPGETSKEQKVTINALATIIGGGESVIDIGCADGLFALRAEALGAGRIVAVDREESRGLREFLLPWFESRIDYRVENFLKPARRDFSSFDVAIFAGVLYHLRYPMLGLKQVYDLLKPGGVLLLETAFIEEFDDLPVLFCPIGDFSPYEPSSVTFFNREGLRQSLLSLGFSDIEVVDSFTYRINKETRFGELRLPSNKTDPIGRIILKAVKRPGRMDIWTDPLWDPETIRSFWDDWRD